MNRAQHIRLWSAAHDGKQHYAHSYGCENCRYFDDRKYSGYTCETETIDDENMGYCYLEPVPVVIDLYRPVCCHYADDIAEPEFYPPLLKNEYEALDPITGRAIEYRDYSGYTAWKAEQEKKAG